MREDLQKNGVADAFEKTWSRYDRLRFARLCLYLRARGPDANVGYSILVFRLTTAEVAGAISARWTDFCKLIEKATVQKP